MNAIELKAKWKRGEASPGMWMSLTDITVAEMIRDVGLDWVAIDTEHTAIDLGTLQNLLIALGDTPTIVRVPGQRSGPHQTCAGHGRCRGHRAAYL